MAAAQNWLVDTTSNAELYFVEDSLKNYSAIIFLNTTGDILDFPQQADFTRYIQAGGGFVGIHAAADAEYQWPWYGKLVGGYFTGHPSDPNVRDGVATIVNNTHSSTVGLPTTWNKKDEFYDYKNFNESVNILVTIDEKSYGHGENSEHPISWYHEYDGGRSFYTGFGHTSESYSEESFLQHLQGGINYSIGKNRLDYRNIAQERYPEPTRFAKQVFATNLDEPMELAVMKDHKVLFIQRKGEIRLWNPETETLKDIIKFPVHTEFEDGLLGLALDPNFEENRWIYLFYSPVGDEWVQHVSRFVFTEEETLDVSSEKVLLKIPVQREMCCHSAGSLEFGPKGNLFISLGDDTSPFNTPKKGDFDADGYAPRDERPGMSGRDAQKSSGNMNDLRGAVLRITPTEDGGYTIPDGNLFPKDGSQGKPEIYAKGCRNPFRIAIDAKRGWLYWGDVGPDAGENNADRGPRGHDEVNQAREAGYFGWPYFVADNKPYRKFNYETGEIGDAYDPEHPINESPNNTGVRELPPANPAFIWYPYAESEEFPLTKKGGRNAMAGPTYYYDMFAGENRLPKYYDGKLIIYDWSRDWIRAVTLDENGDYEMMEPFLEEFPVSNLVDMELAEDGSLYLLEYGKNWFSENPDAILARVDYAPGNRMPVAKIAANKTVGAAPLTVKFTAEESYDFDPDEELTYEWMFEGKTIESSGLTTSHTFNNPGIYETTLLVTDKAGDQNKITMPIRVGNEPPSVTIQLAENKSFYWDGTTLNYEVAVEDKEEGKITEDVKVYFDYQPMGEDLTLIAQGHAQTGAILDGKQLISESDCEACHQLNEKSIGPSYMMVADRYEDDEATIKMIAGKIINGGNGNWGEQAMAAHPQLSENEAEAMATYILKVDQKAARASLPLTGKLTLDEHKKTGTTGYYLLSAEYTDKGSNNIEPLRNEFVVKIRSARLQAEDYDAYNALRKRRPGGKGYTHLDNIRADGWFAFNNIDLTGIDKITARVSGVNKGGYTMELRRSLEGPVIGSATVPFTGGREDWTEINIRLDKPNQEIGDLYVTFSKKEGTPDQAFVTVDWLYFHAKKGFLSLK